MVLHVHLVKLRYHPIVEREFPHKVFVSKVKIDVKKLCRLLLNQGDHASIGFFKQVWQEVRT